MQRSDQSRRPKLEATNILYRYTKNLVLKYFVVSNY